MQDARSHVGGTRKPAETLAAPLRSIQRDAIDAKSAFGAATTDAPLCCSPRGVTALHAQRRAIEGCRGRTPRSHSHTVR